MSARDDLLAAVSFNDAANAGSTPEELVDAYRLEAIGERDAQIIAWLWKKSAEEGRSNRDSRTRGDVLARMADKLSRGAVRPPLSKDAGPVHELSASEQKFLTFALELAADRMAEHGDEFDADDTAALESLRRLTGGAS